MRVPPWIRNPKSMELIKMRVNKTMIPHFADQAWGLEKLPAHYRKAYEEAKTRKPLPVHYDPPAKLVEYDAEHGVIHTFPDPGPIKPLFPPEADYGLWGGEGIVKGFTKRHKYCQLNPRWWFPALQPVAFYSEILDKHMLIVVTRRTMKLVDDAAGFDNYILKTHQVDLASRLGMRLKREMLVALAKKELFAHDPDTRNRLLEKYKEFIIPLEEAEWVGLTLKEAEKKYNKEQYRPPVPLKEVFREQFLQELKRHKAETVTEDDKKHWSGRMAKLFSRKEQEVTSGSAA